MSSHYHGNQTEKRALSAFICLTRANESINPLIHAQLRSENLTGSQFGVLEALLHLGPLTQNEICRKVLKTSGNMTLVIDNLEKNGFVIRTRRSDDRRCNQIELTDKGRRLIERIFPKHAKRIRDVFSVLTDEEQEELTRLCRKLGKGNVAKNDQAEPMRID